MSCLKNIKLAIYYEKQPLQDSSSYYEMLVNALACLLVLECLEKLFFSNLHMKTLSVFNCFTLAIFLKLVCFAYFVYLLLRLIFSPFGNIIKACIYNCHFHSGL